MTHVLCPPSCLASCVSSCLDRVVDVFSMFWLVNRVPLGGCLRRCVGAAPAPRRGVGRPTPSPGHWSLDTARWRVSRALHAHTNLKHWPQEGKTVSVSERVTLSSRAGAVGNARNQLDSRRGTCPCPCGMHRPTHRCHESRSTARRLCASSISPVAQGRDFKSERRRISPTARP